MEALAFSYGPVGVLQDVSFSIPPGYFMGVVGPNGSGKTTLARLISGKLRPTTGALLVDGNTPGTDTFVWDDASRAVWFIGSDPEMQFVTGTTLDEVAFALQTQGMPADEIMATCKDMLLAVGLQDMEDVHPFFLSTGEQFRLLLAVALAQKPHYLLLDEVTSMMDGYTRRDILHLLHEQRSRNGMAMVLFTHRLEDLLHADGIAVLHEGRLAFEGSVLDAFAAVHTHPEWHIEVPLTYQLNQALTPSWRSRLAQVLAT